jgi:fibronectin-binding autotransporter adhesin
MSPSAQPDCRCPRSRRFLRGAVLAAALPGGAALAADLPWIGTTADMNTGSNWTGGVIPGTTDRAVFDGTSATVNPTFSATFEGSGAGFGGVLMTGAHTAALSINSAATAGSVFRLSTPSGITLDSGAGPFTMGTSGNAFFLNLNTTAGTYTFANNSSNTAVIGAQATLNPGGVSTVTGTFTGTGDWQYDGVIRSGSGTMSVAKTGTGTLTLAGANIYTGTTILDQGTMAMGLDQNLSGGLTFGLANASVNNATLNLNNFSATFGSALTVLNNSTTANTVTIGSGKTLTVNGGMTIGYNAAGVGTGATNSRLTMTGAGSFVLTGTTATIGVNQSPTNGDDWNDGQLNVSGLASFSANVTTFNIGVGSTTQGPGTLTLSNTANTILATTLTVGDTGGNNGKGTGRITLGTGTNVIQADTINIGRGKNSGPGVVSFASQASGSPGTLTIANKVGTGAANITVGDNNGTATGGGALGTLDLRGHVVTVNAGTMLIGRNNMGSAAVGGVTGTFSMDAGTLAVTTLNMAPKTGNGTGAANAFFNLSGGTVTVNSGGAVTLGSQATAGSSVATLSITGGTFVSNANITAGAGTTTSTLNLDGGTLDMGGFALGGATAIDNLNLKAGTIRNVLEINNGSTPLTKTGTGSLTLSGANAFSGGLTVSEGTLVLGAADTIPNGAGKGPVTLNPSTTATLNLNGFNDTINGLASSGAGSAVVDNTSATAVTLVVGGGDASASFGGTIQDTGGNITLRKSGNGTQTLTSANSFNGLVDVDDGILSITHSDALGTTTKTLEVAGDAANSRLPELRLSNDIAVNVGQLQTSGAGATGASGAIRNISGNNSITAASAITLVGGNGGSVWQSDAGTLTLNGNIAPNTTGRTLVLQGAGEGVINGAINNGAGANTIPSVTKAGSGTWTLNAVTSGHTGKTILSGGTLVIPTGSEATLGNPAAAADALTFSGGTLRVSTANLTINDANRGVKVTSAGTVEVDGGLTLTMAKNLDAVSGSLTKAGAGTFDLTGGATVFNLTVNAGRMRQSSGTVTVYNGNIGVSGTYQLAGGTLRVDNLVVDGGFEWTDGVITHETTTTGNPIVTELSSPGYQNVGVGNTATINGDLTTGPGTVLALHSSPTLYLSGGVRFNNFHVDGDLNLGASGDLLELEFNPYLLRPFSQLGAAVSEYGSLPLVTWTGVRTGEFDPPTGMLNDGRGFAESAFPVSLASALDPNTYWFEYDDTAKTLFLHYRVAGYVPEPGSFGLLAAGVAGLRLARGLADKRRRLQVPPA